LISRNSFLKKDEVVLSKWVTLIANVYQVSEHENAVYHSFGQSDYVGIMGITKQGLIPLVRQYRPALNCKTIEFPGGLLELDESPKICAQRELHEEVGCFVSEENLIELGCLFPDTGRLSNKLWLFFAKNMIIDENFCKEDQIEHFFVTPEELLHLVDVGDFNHALHISLIFKAFRAKLINI
jgi:8-oxo-dGTP pyrophosphatase MutT (NUDIX family)